MKLYRALTYSFNQPSSYQNLINGNYNETLNLLRTQAFCPSQRYLKSNASYLSECNTFNYNRKMVKYFYASLLDAIKWSIFGDTIIIMELDLPQDDVKDYLGLGFYTTNKVEICLPYDYFHELTKARDSENFNNVLYFWENKKASWSDCEEFQKSLKKEPMIFDLVTNGANPLYPYLCYKSGVPIQVFQTKYTQKMIDFATDKCFERPNVYIDKIMKSDILDIQFLNDYALPYLQEENAEIKRILAKDNHKFRSLK